jgi:hypothetical protein
VNNRDRAREISISKLGKMQTLHHQSTTVNPKRGMNSKKYKD